MRERDAIDLATQLMRGNQYAFFRVAEKREAIVALQPPHRRPDSPAALPEASAV
jgi:hypothetical protein